MHVAEHLSTGSTDPVGYALVTDALDHDGPADPARIDRSVCVRPYHEGMDPVTLPADFAAYAVPRATDAVLGDPRRPGPAREAVGPEDLTARMNLPSTDHVADLATFVCPNDATRLLPAWRGGRAIAGKDPGPQVGARARASSPPGPVRRVTSARASDGSKDVTAARWAAAGDRGAYRAGGRHRAGVDDTTLPGAGSEQCVALQRL